MKNTITWYINELIAAPYIPIFGLLINIMFNMNFITAPKPAAIAGIFDWFTPYNPPVSVWDNAVSIIETEAIINTPAPSEAVGYNISSIGWASDINPNEHGNIIINEAKNEKDNLRDAVFLSLIAKASDIAGVRAVENAKFIASGKLTNVSTFDKIPVADIAACSRASFVIPASCKEICMQLLTVAVSITPLITEISELTVIGIDIPKIVFNNSLSDFLLSGDSIESFVFILLCL